MIEADVRGRRPCLPTIPGEPDSLCLSVPYRFPIPPTGKDQGAAGAVPFYGFTSVRLVEQAVISPRFLQSGCRRRACNGRYVVGRGGRGNPGSRPKPNIDTGGEFDLWPVCRNVGKQGCLRKTNARQHRGSSHHPCHARRSRSDGFDPHPTPLPMSVTDVTPSSAGFGNPRRNQAHRSCRLPQRHTLLAHRR
jgi:hypothetical protein